MEQQKQLTERQIAIQKSLFSFISADPNGIDLNTLGEKVIESLGIEPKVQPKEIGPELLSLQEQGWISGGTRIDPDGHKLIFRPNLRKSQKLARLKCWLRGHDVPSNSAFEHYLALFRGGFCRRCHKLIEKEFLGNVWTEEIDHGAFIENKGYDVSRATNLGLAGYAHSMRTGYAGFFI